MDGEQPPGHYEVGYGKPPQHSRFQPGRSGNPNGRPKGSRNLFTQVLRAGNEKVTVVKDGRRMKLTLLEVIVRQQFKQAATGNHSATRTVLNLVQGVEAQAAQELERASRTEERSLTESDASVLANLQARFFGQENPDDV